ncbi:hypothetical protein L3X38_003574 [Prunus dulcis]|uniref:Uncharacterized protein n=1 Tax=Prunus dulcis TaxID=3755 RepID=A0AAD4ZMA5_PRUDU|nr:hypothetical protein L3X38_003574 [Prunus dulcis]
MLDDILDDIWKDITKNTDSPEADRFHCLKVIGNRWKDWKCRLKHKWSCQLGIQRLKEIRFKSSLALVINCETLRKCLNLGYFKAIKSKRILKVVQNRFE